MKIKTLSEVTPEQVKRLTDQEIGDNYYSLDEIRKMTIQSTQKGKSASFVVLDGEEVMGVRISYPPGQWSKGKGLSLSPHLWPHLQQDTAYFQSLFIAKKWQNQGWGKKLSMQSLAILQEMGAQGVVCHSWVESPQNSSKKYLVSLQFKSICSYPDYWKNVDYLCPRCGKPCVCTAEEMYRDLKENPV